MYEAPSIVSAETASDDTRAMLEPGRFFPNGEEDFELSQNSSLERPLRENESPRLSRIPMKVVAKMPSVNWASSLLLHKSTNKCYDTVLVSDF